MNLTWLVTYDVCIQIKLFFSRIVFIESKIVKETWKEI